MPTGEIIMPMILAPMRYKDFVWPNNPSTCRYRSDRAYVKHKYIELLGVELEDMDLDGIVISGSGEFIGAKAYDTFRALRDAHRSHGVGEFFHPIFDDVTDALMTSLECNIEPRENYISYTFEIVGHTEPIWSPDAVCAVDEFEDPSDASGDGDGGDGDGDSTGNVVYVRGYAYYTSYGTPDPRVEVYGPYVNIPNVDVYGPYVNIQGPIWVDGMYTIIKTNNGAPYPVRISPGWVAWSSIGAKPSLPAKVGNDSNSFTYTIKVGDTLASIADKFGTTYQALASYNGIKNPNSISVGQVIRIPNISVYGPYTNG